MCEQVRTFCWVVLIAAAVPLLCVGQQAPEADSLLTEEPGDTSQVLKRGVRLVESGQYGRAIRLLRPLFEDDPTYREKTHGAVAYWLGRAYQEQGQPQKMVSVLQKGGEGAIERNGELDCQLADAFVQEAIDRRSSEIRQRAARVYLRILGRSGARELSEENREAVTRSLRELAVILPKNVRRRAGLSLDPLTLEIEVSPTPTAGSLLVQWWRSQDPLPATRPNERLPEHLRRVVHARAQYTHEGRMDDRGKVYIRFGKPERQVSIGMEHHETADPIDTPLRRNEFWTYRHVHEKAYYLFVEIQPGHFQLSGADALFPPDMKTGVSSGTSRSRGKALTYLYTMEEALEELATFHPDYSTRATDVFERAAWARDNEQYDIGADPIEGSAGDFLQKMESRIKSEERQNAEKRAQEVPQSYTAVSEDVPDLPVSARTARFLTPEGHTKIEIYWSLPLQALSLTEDLREQGGYESDSSSVTPFVLRAAAVQEKADYREETVQKRQFLVHSSNREGAILPPRSFSVTTEENVFHFALQWDQYAVRERGGKNVQLGDVLRRHTERRDTLTALRSDPQTLEMSDLKLLTVPGEEPLSAVTTDAAVPYPFAKIRPASPLALTFELYHLALDDEGRTRYTVSYTVRRSTDDGGFLETLFGGDEEETTTTTTNQGSRQRTEEYILLELDDFVGDASGTIEVIVRVTDEVSGRQVDRSISLETVVGNE